MIFFLITNDLSGNDWVNRYLTDHPQFRTPVVFSEVELEKNGDNRSFVRAKLHDNLFTRDIFDYQLPLDEDMYFFGRSKDVNSFVDGIRKSQNKGLFGLRKTGKTSLLFKIKRVCEGTSSAYVVYLDCKRPQIRNKNWPALLDYICNQILESCGRKTDWSRKLEPTERLRAILLSIGEDKRVCLIFDEIEFISPIAKLDPHWRREFTDFWQTIWSLQSEIRRLSVIVAGVNPYVTEVDLFNDVQNPMFGIVQSNMLTGFDSESCRSMINRIGKQMGIVFDEEAISYIHSRYGGHPLLTRMACSYTNTQMIDARRPISINLKYMKDSESDRDGELQFYCRHIVSELEQYYKDEFDILTMLARGQIVDFIELAAEPEWIRHLKGYGILEFERASRPAFRIPALQRYMANEAARLEGSREPRAVIRPEGRGPWLERRRRSIISEFKALLRAIASKGLPSPYDGEFLPEADRIAAVAVADSWSGFHSFIVELNLALVETIDRLKGSKYFFGPLRSDFPTLFHSLSRIRVYRNNSEHLRLNRVVESVFNQYILVDLMGKRLSDYEEPWFVLQQIVLDELFVSIQIELSKLS